MSARHVADLRAVDLFDDLDDEQLAAVGGGRASRATLAPGDVLVEQGEPPVGLLLLLEGDARRRCCVDGDRIEPVGRQQAPTWMGAIAVLTGGPLGVRMQAETRLPRRA